MTEIENEPNKIWDVTFYRDALLVIILDGLHIPREVYKLRYTLFVRAANYYNNNNEIARKNLNCAAVLQPFPHCFYDTATKSHRYEDLLTCLLSIPKFSKKNERTTLPELSWQLLHWIFTNPLEIEFMQKSEISDFLTDELRMETKLMTIPCPSSSISRFEINHSSESCSTKAFLKRKKELGSFFAYHGSPGHNFHSIIHRDLICSLNLVTSDLETIRSYSEKHVNVFPNDARASRSTAFDLTNSGKNTRYCVAIVEVIKDPSIALIDVGDRAQLGTLTTETTKFNDTSSSKKKFYVVNSDDLMRLKHLLVYH